MEVIHDKNINTPRVESPAHVIAVGLGTSLEDAMRGATAGMIMNLYDRLYRAP